MRIAVVGRILVALTAVGCTSDGAATPPTDAGALDEDAAGRADGATDEANDAAIVTASCSTGPIYDSTTQFPRNGGQHAGVPCTPHCGQAQHGEWSLGTGLQLYQVGALPSGACAPGTPSCDMDVGRDCGNGPYPVWMSFFCECASGSWSCSGRDEGDGACPLTN